MSDASMIATPIDRPNRNTYLILILARNLQFIDTARALVHWPLYSLAAMRQQFSISAFFLLYLLTFRLCGCGGDTTIWQHSAKLFFFLSSDVSALLHFVMSLFANFFLSFFRKRMKKEKYFYKKDFSLHESLKSMHRRTCYRFNKMPSLTFFRLIMAHCDLWLVRRRTFDFICFVRVYQRLKRRENIMKWKKKK